MTICRYYLMTAKQDHADALRSELVQLRAKVEPMHGCEGVELLQDDGDAAKFHFIERWTSKDMHAAAGKSLGREAFAPVMAVLAEPPVGTYLNPVSSQQH